MSLSANRQSESTCSNCPWGCPAYPQRVLGLQQQWTRSLSSLIPRDSLSTDKKPGSKMGTSPGWIHTPHDKCLLERKRAEGDSMPSSTQVTSPNQGCCSCPHGGLESRAQMLPGGPGAPALSHLAWHPILLSPTLRWLGAPRAVPVSAVCRLTTSLACTVTCRSWPEHGWGRR